MSSEKGSHGAALPRRDHRRARRPAPESQLCDPHVHPSGTCVRPHSNPRTNPIIPPSIEDARAYGHMELCVLLLRDNVLLVPRLSRRWQYFSVTNRLFSFLFFSFLRRCRNGTVPSPHSRAGRRKCLNGDMPLISFVNAVEFGHETFQHAQMTDDRPMLLRATVQCDEGLLFFPSLLRAFLDPTCLNIKYKHITHFPVLV